MKAKTSPTLPLTTQPRRSPGARLRREHWLEAAFDAVVQGGFDALRVLLLAQRLGVTRGSFYWHFADHAELVQALLMRWQDSEAQTVSTLDALHSDEPQSDLQRILEAALAHAGEHLENMRFEQALRDRGRHDAGVAQLLTQVDRARMDLFERKFFRLVGQQSLAADLAALFYLAIVGSHQALARPQHPESTKEYLTQIIRQYVIAWPQSAAPDQTRHGANAAADK